MLELQGQLRKLHKEMEELRKHVGLRKEISERGKEEKGERVMDPGLHDHGGPHGVTKVGP